MEVDVRLKRRMLQSVKIKSLSKCSMYCRLRMTHHSGSCVLDRCIHFKQYASKEIRVEGMEGKAKVQ